MLFLWTIYSSENFIKKCITASINILSCRSVLNNNKKNICVDMAPRHRYVYKLIIKKQILINNFSDLSAVVALWGTPIFAAF